MRTIRTQNIPKIAGGAINLNIGALFSRIFASISQFFQGLFGVRANG